MELLDPDANTDFRAIPQATLHESCMTLKRYTHLRPEQVPEHPAAKPDSEPTTFGQTRKTQTA